MLLIFASARDPAAAALAARWETRDVALLTAADLSVAGWRYRLPPSGSSSLVAGGRPFASCDIEGVLTRLPVIAAQELEHIAAQDRAYVAAEMTAFLLAWLDGLSCPVLNRPTPGGLCGPNWRTVRWIHLAGTLGIPVAPVSYDTAEATAPPAESGATIIVVGERCFGAPDPATAAHARALAAASGADLLGLRFTAGPLPRLLGVTTCPDLSAPEIAGAILDYFDRKTAAC